MTLASDVTSVGRPDERAEVSLATARPTNWEQPLSDEALRICPNQNRFHKRVANGGASEWKDEELLPRQQGKKEIEVSLPTPIAFLTGLAGGESVSVRDEFPNSIESVDKTSLQDRGSLEPFEEIKWRPDIVGQPIEQAGCRHLQVQ